MKTSNILLTAATVVTVIVQVLLLSGYRDAYDRLRTASSKLANVPVEKIHVLCVTNDISLITSGDTNVTYKLNENLVNLIVKADTLFISRKDNVNNEVKNNYQVIILPYLKSIIAKTYDAKVRAVYYKQSQLSLVTDYSSQIELENNRLDSLSCKAIGSSKITVGNSNVVKNLNVEVVYRATFESNNIAYQSVKKKLHDMAQVTLIGKSLKSFGVE